MRLRLSPLELSCLLLIAVGVAFRIYALGRLPGFNGDEAWYGVQALRWEDGAHVDWRTPTGNLVSPMQLGALRLLHSVFDPAPWLLRFPTLISGLLAIAAVGFAAWRAFGRSAGFLAALLFAALPANIVHARFGWDPSHLALFAALATWGAVRRNLVAVVVFYAFGLWVHPTQVFLAPFLALTFLGSTLSAHRVSWAIAMSGAALVALGLCTYGLSVITSGHGQRAPLHEVLSRATSLEQVGAQAVAVSRFFLGDTSFEYISGARFPGSPQLFAAAFWTILLALLVWGVWRSSRERKWLALGMIAGATATHVAFYLLAGPHMLAPHVERFGLTLVVPSVFGMVAIAAAAVKAREVQVRAVAALLLCLLLLTGFARYYLHALHETGSTAHQTFWTGPKEPKVAAVERILSQRRPGAPLVIVANGWWTSWLVAYLTHRDPSVSVVGSPRRYPPTTDLFFLGFPDGPEAGWVKRFGGEAAFERESIPGYGREAALLLWRPRPGAKRGPFL